MKPIESSFQVPGRAGDGVIRFCILGTSLDSLHNRLECCETAVVDKMDSGERMRDRGTDRILWRLGEPELKAAPRFLA